MPQMPVDFVKLVDRYKSDLFDFYLNMHSWRNFKVKAKLQWKRVEFGRGSHAQVPKERGIYVFSLEHRQIKVPPHGYILYVGITGDKGSQSNLHVRYGQYLKYQEKRLGRPAIVYMLRKWNGYLSFYYCAIKNRRTSLANLERKFINSIIPPINKRDFSAEITSVRAAAF